MYKEIEDVLKDSMKIKRTKDAIMEIDNDENIQPDGSDDALAPNLEHTDPLKGIEEGMTTLI